MAEVMPPVAPREEMMSREEATASMEAEKAMEEEKQEIENIYRRVPMTEWEYIAEDDQYVWECPCGDFFSLSTTQLDAGTFVAVCPSCSLRVELVNYITKVAA